MAVLTIDRRDYTFRDYEKLRSGMVDFIATNFPKLNNSFFKDDFPIMTLESTAFAVDNLTWYLDYAFNELLFDRVTERKNIISLAKLIDYELRAKSAAQVTMDCTTDPYTPNLTITKGTQFPGPGGVTYEVSSNITVTGATSFTVPALQGETIIDNFISDGSALQFFITNQGDAAGNVAVIVRVDATPWTSVDTLFGVGTGEFYEAQFTDDGRIRVSFGDGLNGDIPLGGAAIEIEYFTTEGSGGNFAQGLIVSSFNGDAGGPHEVQCINTNSASSGGEDEETVEEARKNAPASLRALNRLVTEGDYKAIIEQIAGVLSVSVSVQNTLRTITIVVLADGFLPASPALIDTITIEIEDKKMIGIIHKFKDPVFIDIDIDANVFVQANADPLLVEEQVRAAWSEFLQPTDPNTIALLVDFGRSLFISDVLALLDGVSGVDHVDLNTLSITPIVTLVTWNGDSTIDNITISDTTLDETWTIAFITTTTFTVSGSVSGLQVNTGSVDTPYVSDDGEIAFIVTSGSVAQFAGDTATIRVKPKRANIVLASDEVFREGISVFTTFVVT